MTVRNWLRRFGWLTAVLAAGVVAVGVMLWQPKEKSSAADGYLRLGTARLVQLTDSRGLELSPALSPDGSRLAYVWNGPNRDNYDVYVKILGSSTPPVRVTEAPEADLWPAWSPDGRRLAFIRDGTVYVAGYGGEEERKLSEAKAGTIAWTSDGKWIAAASGSQGISLVRVSDGGRRWLRHSDRTEYGDPFFAMSSDRTRLVVARFESETNADLYLDGDAEDRTRPLRRLTSHERPIYGLSWLEASASLFYASGRDAYTTRLYRLAIDQVGNAKVEELTAAGDHVAEPSAVVRDGNVEVAYTHFKLDANLYSWTPGGKPRRILDWASEETSPHLSADGKRLAFISNREGSEELWIANADGTNPVRLTRFGDAHVNGARWSPNGRSVVFAAEIRGNRDIWVADTGGRAPRRLTTEPSEEARPSWSADGAWIYFSSTRTGQPEIFRTSLGGERVEKVTDGGGFEAMESSDGETLYFTRARRQGLWAQKRGGNKVDRVLYLVAPGYWDISDRGVAYFDMAQAQGVGMRQSLLEWADWGVKPDTSLMSFDWKTHVVKRELSIGERVIRARPGLSISRDGNTVVWSQVDSAESDLMLMRMPMPSAGPVLKGYSQR